MIIKDIQFQHPHSSQPVLRSVSFENRPGAINVILGPNGSGKTTLFKCIAGLWRPQQGQVILEGTDLLTIAGPARARMVAVVPQEHEPPFPYSVADIVLMGRAAHIPAYAAPGRKDVAVAEAALDTLGIRHLGEKVYTRISGGERQLTLLARALAQQTPVLLLDEPTSHLDFRNQLLVLKKVKAICRDRALTVLMTLHDPNLALMFADQVVVLNEGGVIAAGQPDAVITEAMIAQVYGVDVVMLDNHGRRVISPRADK